MRRPRTRRPAAAEAVLPSGLRVVALRRPASPLVEVRLRIPFGGRGGRYTARHAAVAELLAATTMLGTAHRDREQIDIALADVGGHLDAAVDPQRLLYTGSVLAGGLPALLEVLAEVLSVPVYRSRDVAGERDRLAEHLALAGAQPAVVARMALQQQRFGDHPAATEMPSAELTAQVGPVAVRGLHRRSVVPQGSTLVLVGDLTPRRAVDQAAAALSGWTGAKPATPMSSPPAVSGGPLAALHRAGSVQSQVRLSTAAIGRAHPDYPALQLANLIYSGYFSSRLVENIREDKGYTYGAHSGIEFWPGTAAVTISFDTTTESTAAALLEARYELGRMALLPPSEAELDAARNYALGSLAISLSTQAGYASMLSTVYGSGLDLQWLQGHPARLSAVTVEQVADAGAAYLAPSAATGVVVADLDAIAGALQRVGGVTLP